MTEELRAAVAARLRDLADRVAADDLDPDRAAAVVAALEPLDAALPPGAEPRSRYARGFPAVPHPLAEGSSPVYPPLEVEIGDRSLVARTSFGPAWEGPPDLVHGGFLAAGFDMVLSSLATHVLGHAVTRRLHIRYLKPTFTGAALRYEVEAAEPQGRLLELRGRLLADGQTTMRARAEFASIPEHRFADRRPAGAEASTN